MIAKGGTLRILQYNSKLGNPNLMEKLMNIKRAFLVLAAALLMPGLVMAGATSFATFEVDFNFDDNNPVATTAYISCDGGLPIKSEQEIKDGDNIIFVVNHPEDPNDIDCRVWVDDVDNYTTDYECYNSDSSCSDYDLSDDNADGPGCFYTSVELLDENECEVDLYPDDALLEVYKTWEVLGNRAQANLDTIDFKARLIACASDQGVIQDSVLTDRGYCVRKTVTGPGPQHMDVYFNTHWEGNTIRIFERIFDSSVESDASDCPNFTVFPGGDYECTVVNTVFYEGIPTLNQYGLAIMVLLMLGVGFVGFRRFV